MRISNDTAILVAGNNFSPDNDNFAVNDDHDDFGDDYDHDHDNHDDLDDHGDLGNDDHFHTSKKLD